MWHLLGGRTLSKPHQSNLDSPQPQEAWRSRHIWNWMVSYLFQNELEFSSIFSPESVSGQIKQNWTCLKLLKTLWLRGNQWNGSVEVWNFDWKNERITDGIVDLSFQKGLSQFWNKCNTFVCLSFSPLWTLVSIFVSPPTSICSFACLIVSALKALSAVTLVVIG